MKTFIKITEIWIPNKERTHLKLSDGIYSDYQEFHDISINKQFAYNQGLPGKVWATSTPIVINQLDSSYYERAETARKAGLTCAIGMPILSGESLMAVVVFLCGADDENSGAIEVWTNSFQKTKQLHIQDGYYGKLKNFEEISKKTTLIKGAGLAGMVWSKELPVIMEDLGHISAFMRGKDALNAGLTEGLGIPINLNQGRIYIMTFLSAISTPLAKRLQIWLPDVEHQSLHCQATYGKENNDLANLFELQPIQKGESLVGEAWLSGIPVIGKSIVNGNSSDPAAISSLLAIPVTDSGVLKAVVTFLF